MTIKQYGGIFGRNPTFNNVGVQGSLTGISNLSISGNLIVASGNGIDFSATPNTGTSELFSDYEEGTYTATLTPNVSGTITLNPGVDLVAYTKIGRLVNLNGFIQGSGVSSPVGTFVRMSLPFAILNIAEFSGALGGALFLNNSGVLSQLLFEGVEGETAIRINVDPSILAANAAYKFNFSYLT